MTLKILKIYLYTKLQELTFSGSIIIPKLTLSVNEYVCDVL